MKIITFSYDDSMQEDIELVKLFDKYNLVGTFNINTGLYDGSRISYELQKEIYKNHEVCVHTLSHPHLEELSVKEMRKELLEDKENIQKMFNRDCIGMAYPFGTYNEKVISTAREIGIKHARTVFTTNDFVIPKNPMELQQTTHHNNPDLMKLGEKFISLDGSKGDYLFSIWGHSFEFTQENTKLSFQQFEKFLKLIANKDDILYLGVSTALRKLNII